MNCPTLVQLQALLNELLSASEQAGLEEHIENCKSCQQALTGLLEEGESRPDQRAAPALSGETDPFVDYLRTNPPDLSDDADTPAEALPLHFPGPPTRDGPLGQLECYHIRARLGAGTFGYVYKAWDEQLRQEVALKILKPELVGDPTERSRFEREARKTARVRHEHVVAIHRFGTSADFAPPFLVMEFIDGESLQACLNREGALAPADAARIAQQVALGLAAAHAEGVVHRDIKPSNIMLEKRTGRVKVTDFGLARATEASVNISHGNISGTPAYMSPEQIHTPQHIDGRSDVFSLGSVLYQLLTGAAPFSGNLLTILEQVKCADPTSPRRLNRDIPRVLEAITLKCLAKEPDRRYASAQALAEDLRRWAADEPTIARPMGRLEYGWRWARRNPALASVSGLAIFSLLLALVVAVVQNYRLQEQLRMAARMALAQGAAFCEQGDVERGALWFARSLELAPSGDADLERSLRQQLASWRPHLPTLQATWQLPEGIRVRAAALSPGGAVVVLACEDKSVRFYDAAGEPQGQPIFTAAQVDRIDFHPQGKRFLTRSVDKTLQLWDVATGNAVGEALPSRPGNLLAVGFRGDQSVLRAYRFEKQVSIWNGERETSINCENQPVAAAFSADGKRLLLRSEKAIACWKWTTNEIKVSPPQATEIRDASISPDGATIVTASADDKIRLWTRATDNKLATDINKPFASHPGEVSEIRFSADGKTIVTHGKEEAWRRWDAATRHLAGPAFRPLPLAVDPSATHLFTTSAAGQCWLWEAASYPQPIRLDGLDGLEGKIKAAAFTEDGAAVRMLDDESALWTWNLQADKPATLDHRFPEGSGRLVPSVDVSLFLRHDPPECWDVARRAKLPLKLADATDFSLLLASGDGQIVAVVADQDIHLFDAKDGKSVRTINVGKSVIALAFHPTRGMLLSGDGDVNSSPGDAQLWDIASGKARKRLIHEKPVRSVAFDHSGDRILTGCGDGSARVWSIISGGQVGEPLLVSKEKVSAVAFSRNDYWAATAAWDRTLRVWETASHLPVGGSFRCRDEILSVAFHPKQPRLLTLSRTSNIQLWNIPEPKAGTPLQIRLWLQVITGTEMDADGTVKRLPSEDWQRHRDEWRKAGFTSPS